MHACNTPVNQKIPTPRQQSMLLGIWLAGTQTIGIMFRPASEITLDLHVEADFAGQWSSVADNQDPSRAKSRAGHVLLLARCPLLWVPKLQTEIESSTLEAELITQSTDLIPVRATLQTIAKKIGINVSEGESL
jgi:hypothetical protein